MVFYFDESSFYPAKKGKSRRIYVNQDLNGSILFNPEIWRIRIRIQFLDPDPPHFEVYT